MNVTLKESVHGEECTFYDNVLVSRSTLGSRVSIGSDTVVSRTMIDHNVIINRRNYVNDSVIGSFTYTGIGTIINFARIGKYCSIARNVDIGGFDHDYDRLTTMPYWRYAQLSGQNGGREALQAPDYKDSCLIGNDVWIAAGAQILHKATSVADGAIVGAGAVVTKPVPPYAIVAGVPARIIGYRFSADIRERLLALKWWDLPDDVIAGHMDVFTSQKIDHVMLDQIEQIKIMDGKK